MKFLTQDEGKTKTLFSLDLRHRPLALERVRAARVAMRLPPPVRCLQPIAGPAAERSLEIS